MRNIVRDHDFRRRSAPQTGTKWMDGRTPHQRHATQHQHLGHKYWTRNAWKPTLSRMNRLGKYAARFLHIAKDE